MARRRADEDTRRKLLTKTLHAEDPDEQSEQLFVTPLQLEEMRRDLAQLDRQRKTKTLIREISKEEIAAEAGLSTLYRKHFAYFSLFTHITPTGMRNLVATNDKNEITHFRRTGMFYDDALPNLRSGIEFMLMAFDTANGLFALQIDSEFDQFRRRFDSLLAKVDERNSAGPSA